MNNIKILLLDGHTVQAYSVAKALRKSNFHITLFYEKTISFGSASRYPHKKIKCPSISASKTKFLSFLTNFLKTNKIDLIIPLFDESADIVTKYRSNIELLGIKIGLPPIKQYNIARNKTLLMQFCKKNNIPHPKTLPIRKENYNNVAKEIGFPSLLKPGNSSGGNGIIHMNSIEQLSTYFLNSHENHLDLSLQSYVPHSGHYFNSMLYRTKEGFFSKVVIIKISRYFPIKGGTGSYSETVEHSEIEKISKETLEKLKWIGFADLDFMVDKHSLQPKLIEINPRTPACIHSAFVSGINFPEIIVYDIFGKKIPQQKFITKQKTRYLGMDILWFIFNKKRFKTFPFWFKFFEKNLHYQDGCLNDPFTMIAGILMGLNKYLFNKKYRRSKLNNI